MTDISFAHTPQGAFRPPAGQHGWLRSKGFWLDLTERTILTVMFGFFAVRMMESFDFRSGIATPLMVLSEVLPIALIIARKWATSTSISDEPLDWFLAFIGANTVLLATPAAGEPLISPMLCSLVILAGLMLQIAAKLILWRSFGIVPANFGVKIAGPYRFVRHPMYLGYTIAHIGFLLAFPSGWNAMVYWSALVVQIARLAREERLLARDSAYCEYATRVRYRLCPGVY
jgi:protein-S-isoprenylcysteine O-methyltransferase Ste14